MWNYVNDTRVHLTHEYGEKPLPESWIDVKPKPETAKALGWEISREPASDWYRQYVYDLQDFAVSEPGSKEYMELAEKIFEGRVKLLSDIGIVGLAPKPFIVKNTIGNAPRPGYLPLFKRWTDPIEMIEHECAFP